MKKNGTLNRDIASVLARLGHTDTIVISDCGLPIPDNVTCIDVSLKLGTPSFIDVLETVLIDMKVEHVTLANEIKLNNPKLHHATGFLLPETKLSYCDHEQFKTQTKTAKAIIRTGEATPFANIILQSGVIF